MTEETKRKLIDSGRQDLVDTYVILMSGYAGVNQQGTIVDRRVHPDAVPIQENPLFNTPPPKVL